MRKNSSMREEEGGGGKGKLLKSLGSFGRKIILTVASFFHFFLCEILRERERKRERERERQPSLSLSLSPVLVTRYVMAAWHESRKEAQTTALVKYHCLDQQEEEEGGDLWKNIDHMAWQQQPWHSGEEGGGRRRRRRRRRREGGRPTEQILPESMKREKGKKKGENRGRNNF